MFELTPYERRHQRALFNPFRDMENFEKNFWGDMAATDFKTDIKDNGKEYVLEAELPGFKKEDIHVDIEDGYMTISAERSNETEKKDDKGNFVRRERSYGSFSRSFDVSLMEYRPLHSSCGTNPTNVVLPVQTPYPFHVK